nr:MDIS1-interacting receptor like kinase 2-like [Tanacetum cinerariifolium]
RSKKMSSTQPKDEDIFSISTFNGREIYHEILKVTEEFKEVYCIGKGGCGSVYKASLASGDTVAVKRLHPARPLSLADILKSETAHYLDWNKRVNIIKGVAHALSYMHHDCSPPIVHRDISSKNILLDSDYEACVSDFGTSKILNKESSNWSNVAGTYGYLAPGLVPCSRMKSGFLSSRGRGVKQKRGSNARKTTMTSGKDVEGVSSMIDQPLVGQFTSFSDAYGSPSPFTLEEILRDIKRQIYVGKLLLVGDDGKQLKPSRLVGIYKLVNQLTVTSTQRIWIVYDVHD